MSTDRLLELLRIELGVQETITAPLTDAEWENVVRLAKKHCVIGLVYGAIQKLPDDYKPQRKIKLQFAITSEKIQQKNALLNEQCRQITKELSALSLKSCILKGQGLAMLYPHPDLRQCGDIDVWVTNNESGMVDRRQIVNLIDSKWTTGKTFYHHVDIKPFGPDGTEVEVHFTPSWMNSPLSNDKLQKYFAKSAGRQFENYFLDKGFNAPTNDFNTVYGMIHLYRHLMTEGFGLRQLCDYYEILTHSSSEDRLAAMKVFLSLEMKPFVAAMMYVLKEMFLLEDRYLICKPDSVRGSVMYNEICKAGNFGKYDSRNINMSSGYNVSTFLKKTVRVFRYFPLAPSEALCSPGFRLWQYFWRKKNNDLFK